MYIRNFRVIKNQVPVRTTLIQKMRLFILTIFFSSKNDDHKNSIKISSRNQN